METDPDNWPIYHGMIKADESETRLRHDNRDGSYLVRYAGGDYILSYIRGSIIKHIKLSFSQDTNLRKCHPGINDIKKTVSFITGLKMHFLFFKIQLHLGVQQLIIFNALHKIKTKDFIVSQLFIL